MHIIMYGILNKVGFIVAILRFHLLDLVLGVAVVALFLGARFLVFPRGTFLVLAARFGGTVELVFSDSWDIALRGSVLRHVQRV